MTEEEKSANKGSPSLEKANMQDTDMQDIHAQLMREKEEPREGFSPIPIFSTFCLCSVMFLGRRLFC